MREDTAHLPGPTMTAVIEALNCSSILSARHGIADAREAFPSTPRSRLCEATHA
jgi:hypothetical protein